MKNISHFILAVFLIANTLTNAQNYQMVYSATQNEIFGGIDTTNDGHILITGFTESFSSSKDIFVIKTDMLGNIEWSKTFGGANEDEGWVVRQGSDGNYVVTGFTKSYGAGDADIFLMKIDTLGNLLWFKTYGRTGSDRGYDIQIMKHGFLLVSVATNMGAITATDLLLIRVDEMGNAMWAKTYGKPNQDGLFSVTPSTDNASFVLIGSSFSFGSNYQAVATKIDTTGNPVWFKSYGGAVLDGGRAICKANDGGYILGGYTNTYGTGSYDYLIIHIDEIGDVVWSRTFGGIDEEVPFHVIPHHNDGYMVHGYTKSYGYGNSDIHLMKINNDGSLAWGKNYGTAGNESGAGGPNYKDFKALCQIAPNDFLFSDYSAPQTNNGEIILLRMDSNAVINNCNYMNISMQTGTVTLSAVTQTIDTMSHFNFTGTYTPSIASVTFIKNNTCGCIAFVDLGPDTNICKSGASYLLNAGSGYSPYTWQDGSHSSTLIVSQTGIYSVTVTDDFGCSDSDSVYVSFGAAPIVNLGNDTTLCNNSFFTLDAGSGFASYNWNSGPTSQTINVNIPGTYTVTVTTFAGCFGIDSVDIVSGYTPDVNLGNDTVVCSLSPFYLDAGNGNFNYSWNDGTTTQYCLTAITGVYSVTVTDISGCSSSDSILINFLQSPISLLPTDTIICSGLSVFLNAGSGFTNYMWSTGQSDTAISINSSGTYWVSISNSLGCNSIDTVNVYDGIPPVVNLGPDSSFCDGSYITFDAGGSGYETYLWQDNSTAQTFNANSPGVYYVYASNPCGTGSDTVIINTLYTPLSFSFGNDTVLCNGSTLVLNPGTGYTSYLWQNNSTGQIYNVNLSGNYYVIVTDTNGCSSSDTINVSFVVCTGILSENHSGISYLFSQDHILKINGLLPENIQIFLFDISGKVIRVINSKGANTINLDLSNYPSGMYIIKIDSETYNPMIIKLVK